MVARHDDNPLRVIKNVKEKIREIAPGLPRKAVADWSKIHPDALRHFAAERGFEAFTNDETFMTGDQTDLIEMRVTIRPGSRLRPD